MFCGLLGHIFIYFKKRAKYREIFLKINAFSFIKKGKAHGSWDKWTVCSL